MCLWEQRNTDFSGCCLSDLLVHQESTAPDGFLSSAEFSVWASTMRLREDEAHPVLKQSQFMTLPADLQTQVFFFIFLCNYAPVIAIEANPLKAKIQLVLNHTQFLF